MALVCNIDECTSASGLDPKMLHLVRIRASQIYDCRPCIAQYTSAARIAGEEEQRLSALGGWRNVSHFSPRERAALTWAEAVMLVVGQRVPDWVYEASREYFSDLDLIVLAAAAAAASGRCRR